MPEVHSPLLELWQKSGQVGPDMSPLSWSEIAGFAAVFDLDQDEAETIRAMSAAYVSGYHTGEEALGRPPWEPSE